MLTLTLLPDRTDPLGILASTAPVVAGSLSVRIDPDAVERLAAELRPAEPPVLAEDSFHCAFLPPRRFANYLLVLEALNFCFWDDPPRWTVMARGVAHDGYWALAAALHRAVREDATPIWDAQWMAAVTPEALALVLRGTGRPPPLLPERAANVREAGTRLLASWDGEFANVIAAAQSDAPTLAERITSEFHSFQDEADWRDPATGLTYRARFLKRAQICVADLARLLPGEPLAKLRGLDQLTAFADYKVPQVLRKLGILVYSEGLGARLERGEELRAGSADEVEIRAATIWSCEWIARAWSSRQGAPVAASEVDYRLWLMGQKKTGLRPYHRTRTIFY